MKKTALILSILIGGLAFITPLEKVIFAQEKNTKKVEQSMNLTQDDAKKLLIDFNNKVDYIYQGTHKDFKYLQEKGLKGFVFLPDVETDIGYFVDENTSHIYAFHPSGYLELEK